ncbi:MAG: hypothetical protein SV760_01900, partial [Halobacteria archaeon]|nr:hypothetical protein [Halobacteria archaeon]
EGVFPGNADHWIDVYNYNNNLWPKGEAHNDAAEFVQNAKDYVGWGYTNYGMKLLGRGQHFMADMGQAYHTILWDNIGNDHFNYESWVDNNWESENLKDWTSYGAYYSYRLDISSKSDVKQTTVELARDANGRKGKIFSGKWDNNVWATQYNLWDTGQHLGATFDYAAPGYFSY